MNPNQQQSAAWNGPEAVHYVDHADRYDRQLAPVTEALLTRAAISDRDTVLDVGCGTGAMTLAAAPRAGRVVGVDISEPLIRVAAERAREVPAGNVEFLVADAQIHDFGDTTFDLLISQFGLMFFDDPVGAFSNLRRAMNQGGRIVFSTWQGLEANEWLSPVARAVGQYTELPALGGLAAGGGMFALKDEMEITGLLHRAGFVDITVEPLAPSLRIGGGGNLGQCADFLFGMGIVRGLLSRVDESQRRSAVSAVRTDLAECYEPGEGVRLGAGVWLVSASRSVKRREPRDVVG